MACIDRVPKCGLGEAKDSVSDPLPDLGSALATIFAIIGGVAGVLALDKAALAKVLAALGGSVAAGAITAAMAVITVLVLIGMYGFNRCLEGKGLSVCAAGVVSEIEESFSDALQELFPFAGQHTRVDVTVKSKYWDYLELSNAYVYCTGSKNHRISEILRCYYYTRSVCTAITGSLYGAAIGGAAGIVAAAAAVGAIGCATVILCLLALLLAALIAIAAALVGAFAGGQIVKAATSDTSPAGTTDAGTKSTLMVGDLVTVSGNLEQRDFDEQANVLWWTHGTALHGKIASGTSEPWSYCDIDGQLPDDACGGDGGDDSEDPDTPPEPPR